MIEAAYNFFYDGNPVSSELLNAGHINRTYLITTSAERKYVLQCLNSVAFHNIPGLMGNAVAVSKHILSKGGKTLKFISASDGRYYWIDGSGEYWRSYEFVDNCICLVHPESPEVFYESAVAFGEFQNMLSDFPAETLCETIPRFHDTPDRYLNFRKAVEEDRAGRVSSVRGEIEFALEREPFADTLTGLLREGRLPLRVTHNDTKLSNVLLDSRTKKAVCVIDLDTVMPGLTAYDFGDAIRFGCSTAPEDEKDLSKVSLDLNLYRVFARGFLRACPNLTEEERSSLPYGARMLTLENSIRFLGDYLDGDVYYHTDYPEHNLVRARTHFKLISEMEKHWEEMLAIVEETPSA